MLLMVHRELFLLRVMLIGSIVFMVASSKFQSKNRLELQEQRETYWNYQLDLGFTTSTRDQKVRASAINKEFLQILSRNYFLLKGKKNEKSIVLSGYVCVLILFHRKGCFRAQRCLGHTWGYGLATILCYEYYAGCFCQLSSILYLKMLYFTSKVENSGSTNCRKNDMI